MTTDHDFSTKRVVRRRVRKGALSPGGSRGEGTGSGIQSAIRSIQFRRSNNAQGKGSNTQDIELKSQIASATPQQRYTSTLQHPSILQELELELDGDGDTPRKGSWTTSSGSGSGSGKEKGSSVSDNRL